MSNLREAFTGRRIWPLESNALCERARKQTGLEDFGDPPIDPALSILTRSLEREADLHPVGRFLIHGHLLDLLRTRLRLVSAWRERGEALTQTPIRGPIFITGMPRSGSSFLHELLVQDPDNRAPRVWEVMFPLPAPRLNGRSENARIHKAAARLWIFRRLAPEADTVCPIRALTPHECLAIHSYTMLSFEFCSTCRIRSYETFVRNSDLTPVYAWEKRFLQHLQSALPTKRWVLKAPDHVCGLDALFAVFPDAYVIQTHRDPLEVLESSAQLLRVLHGLYARDADLAEVADDAARTMRDNMDRAMRFRDLHPKLAGRFVDVNYAELVSDPSLVIHRIYRQLELPLGEMARAQMRRFISGRCRYPRHRHLTLAELGLNAQEQLRRFDDYCFRFGQQPQAD
jgi:hypothetical protein